MKYYHSTLLGLIILLLFIVFPNNIYAESFFEITQNITIKNPSSSDAKNVVATVIIGNDYFSPYAKTEYKKINPNPNSYFTDEYGNSYAEFKLDNIPAYSSVTFNITRIIKNGIPITKLTFKNGKNYSFSLDDVDSNKYLLTSQTGIDSENDAMINKANSLVKSTDSKFDKLIKYFSFVNMDMTYDSSSQYTNKGSLSALNTLRGVCEEYATLLTALCRTQGIPARVVIGYRLDDNNMNELIRGSSIKSEPNAHAWVEVYTPEIGYIPIEPTFLYTVNGRKTLYTDGLYNIDTKFYLPTSLYNIDKNTVDIRYNYIGSQAPELETIIDDNNTIRKVPSNYTLEDPTFMYNTSIIEPTPVIEKNLFEKIWDNILFIFSYITNLITTLFQ